MEVNGRYTFDAPITRVWDVLMDTGVIAQCLPGCERLEPIGEDRYRATMKLAVAAITGTYQGTVVIADKQPPRSYRLLVDGSGRPGFVKGATVVSLSADGDRTVVEIAGDVNVGGAVARVGQRLLGGVSRMMMDRFFACLQQKAAVPRPS